MSALGDLFGQIEHQPIPGGCERCDAFQTVELELPGVWRLTVHHDSWCPFLRSRTAAAN